MATKPHFPQNSLPRISGRLVFAKHQLSCSFISVKVTLDPRETCVLITDSVGRIRKMVKLKRPAYTYKPRLQFRMKQPSVAITALGAIYQ